ncbi:TPA: O-antigen polymerase [Vibrio diabolicus]|uniref:O-antigen polymerase n=1 Tax=Vibrio diabolicus TaxID=50719 RepID=UPI003D7E4765
MLIFFSLIIFITPLIYELLRQVLFLRFDGLSVINISFSIIYGLTSFLITIDVLGVNTNNNQLDHFNFPSIYSLSLILISYVSCVVSYNYISFNNIKIPSHLTNERIDSIIFKSSFISLILSFICVFAYSSQYGGITNAIKMAGIIRSGYGDDHLVGSGNTLFLKYLLPLCIYFGLSSFYFILKSKSRSYLKWVIFILITLYCAFCFLLMSGRGRIVLYLCQLIILYFYLKSDGKKLSIKLIFILIIGLSLSLFVVNYGKSFFNQLSNDSGISVSNVKNENDSNLLSFSEYYVHRVASIDVSIFTPNQKYTYFYDLIYSPMYFIPERITGIKKPESISFVNTLNYIGIKDSIVPPGIVAYGYLSLGVLGVVLISIFVAGFLKLITVLFYNKENALIVVYVPAISYLGNYLFASDPRVTINATVHLVIFLLISFVVSKRVRFL